MDWNNRREILGYKKRLPEEARLKAETYVAAQLLDDYEPYRRDTHAVLIITYLGEQFGESSGFLTPSVFRGLYFEIGEYLDAWYANLEVKNGLHEEECAIAGKALTMLVLSKIRPDLIEPEALEIQVQPGVTAPQAIAFLQQADDFISQAQELFAPLEGLAHETIKRSSLLPLLHAALKFQAARRFLEEGTGILEGYGEVDIQQLVTSVTAPCHSDDRIIKEGQ
jgi:hypothetical protein